MKRVQIVGKAEDGAISQAENCLKDAKKFILMAERACISANTLKQGFEVTARVAEAVKD